MYYLIDGYNFLFRLKPKDPSLEKKRGQFLEILIEELSSRNIKASIIFDNAAEIRNIPQNILHATLEVIFTPQNQTADEYILEFLNYQKNLRIFTVVTSDNRLASQCQHLGTSTLSIENFLIFILKKKRKKFEGKKIPKESRERQEFLRKIFEQRFKEN